MKLRLQDTDLMKELLSRDSKFYSGIIELYEVISPLLDHRIAQVFSQYTQHDSQHSIRIIQHMKSIINNIKEFNDFEIAILIYSALLHDIGMAASEDEIQEIKKGTLKYTNISYSAILSKFNNDEELAIQDYLRRVHAKRSSDYILKNLNKSFTIPEMISITFEKEIALVCEAHTEDVSWIKDNLLTLSKKGDYQYNLQFIALVLRLADILDFDSQRTPWKLYQSIAPQGYSDGEWLQHYTISNNNKISVKENGQKVIELYGTCEDPKIHRKILGYIDWINSEIENINDLSKNYSEKYKTNFYYKVNNFITSDNYSIIDLKFKVNYKRILKLLMGEELYGNRELGLREIIQNSIDACMLRKEIFDAGKEEYEEEFKPKVLVIFDKINNKVTIKDNGIGMNMTILKKYFLELGASYYNSEDYILSDFNYTPIGNYGIGFLASFMLSDTVKVKTRHFNESSTIEMEIYKEDEYICIKSERDLNFSGTEVIFAYDDFFDVWESSQKVREFLNNEFLLSNIDITVIDKEDNSKRYPINNKENTFFSKFNKESIDLSEYLDNVDAFITSYNDIKNIFIEKFEEISFDGVPYIFVNKELYNLDEDGTVNHKISNFINGEELEVLNIILIDDSDDIEKVLEYFDDDFDEAKEKYIEKFNPESVSLIALPDEIYEAPNGYDDVSQIVEGLKFDMFEEHHDNGFGTFFEKEKIRLFNSEKYEKYIPINSENIWDFKKSKKLFIRGVFVKNTDFNINNRMLNFNIDNLLINVKNRNIKPNVNRTSLRKEDELLIINSVYQALCIYIYENLGDVIEKAIFKEYIKKYHNYKETLVKQEYINKLFLKE